MNKDTHVLKFILIATMAVVSCGVVFSWLYYSKLSELLIIVIFIFGTVFNFSMLYLMNRLDDLEEKRRTLHGSRKELRK